MPIELKMPALSPTMEEGTLAKWLVKEGDKVKPGDLLAEIETDKATMEFEAVDEGTIAKLVVAEGAEGVKVGVAIALLADGSENAAAAEPSKLTAEKLAPKPARKDAPDEGGAVPPVRVEVREDAGKSEDEGNHTTPQYAAAADSASDAGLVKVSPLARRLAAARGVDLGTIQGSGSGGRIVKADLDWPGGAQVRPAAEAVTATFAEQTPQAGPAKSGRLQLPYDAIPHEAAKLSNMRKVIARRLTESKQQVPHIYLTVDILLDPLLKLRAELNKGLEGRGIKLSVNDLLIKAQAAALIEVPSCNVQLAGDQLVTFGRADISVAVSIPGGLITPIIVGADSKPVSAIAQEMKDLATRAKDGKLKPEEYQGGTASISNMGMFGIKQFDAVINPPQGMILAIGAGEKRPYVVGDELKVATVMSATGSFDHRAIDGADGAQFMAAFKRLVQNPMEAIA